MRSSLFYQVPKEFSGEMLHYKSDDPSGTCVHQQACAVHSVSFRARLFTPKSVMLEHDVEKEAEGPHERTFLAFILFSLSTRCPWATIPKLQGRVYCKYVYQSTKLEKKSAFVCTVFNIIFSAIHLHCRV